MTSELVTSSTETSRRVVGTQLTVDFDNDMTNENITSNSVLPMTPPYTPSQHSVPITDSQLVRQRKKCKLNSLLDKIKFKAQQSGTNNCLTNGDAFLPLMENGDRTPPSSNPPPELTSPRYSSSHSFILSPTSCSDNNQTSTSITLAKVAKSNTCSGYGIESILSNSFNSKKIDTNKSSHNLFFANECHAELINNRNKVPTSPDIQSNSPIKYPSSTEDNTKAISDSPNNKKINNDCDTNISSNIDCSDEADDIPILTCNNSEDTKIVQDPSTNTDSIPILTDVKSDISIDNITDKCKSVSPCKNDEIEEIPSPISPCKDDEIEETIISPKLNETPNLLENKEINIEDENSIPEDISNSPIEDEVKIESKIDDEKETPTNVKIGLDSCENTLSEDPIQETTDSNNKENITDFPLPEISEIMSPKETSLPLFIEQSTENEPLNSPHSIQSIKDNCEITLNSPALPIINHEEHPITQDITPVSPPLNNNHTTSPQTINTAVNLFPIPTSSTPSSTKLPSDIIMKSTNSAQSDNNMFNTLRIDTTYNSFQNNVLNSKPCSPSKTTSILDQQTPLLNQPEVPVTKVPSPIVYEDSLDQTINEVAYNLNGIFSPDDYSSEHSSHYMDDKINSVEYEDKDGTLKLVFRKSPNDSVSSFSSRSESSSISAVPSQHICKHCGFDAKRRALYRKHLAGEHSLFLCAHCPYITGSNQKMIGQSMLNEHVATIHPEKSGRKKCRRCQRVVPHCEVDAHESVCTGETPVWICEECNRTFRFESQLRQHARAHKAGTIGLMEIDDIPVREIQQRKRIHQCEFCKYRLENLIFHM